MPSFTLDTPHGLISITDTTLSSPHPPLLLLHGNSSSSRIFSHILSSPLSQTHRLITFDYPGHGASSNAPDARESYWMHGYAQLAVHILQHLRIEKIVVFGWSLGGHVGIEMVPLLKEPTPRIELLGLMITGTPPARGRDEVSRGFMFVWDESFAGRREWNDDDAVAFAKSSAARGDPKYFEPWMLEDARRTDGRARMMMGERLNGDIGEGVDQRRIVEEEDVLVAVVNGAEEQFVNLEYLEEIKWKNLWGNKCVRLEGLAHAPFWEEPELFEGILKEFLEDCEKGT